MILHLKRFCARGNPFPPGILIFLLLIVITAGCNVAPTVTILPEFIITPSEDQGLPNPQVQIVYPGTLQSLDVPQPYFTDIDPSAANFVIVFSHDMENNANEMALSLSLFEEGIWVPMNLTPSTTSRYFIVTPADGIFKPNTVYSLSVSKSASALIDGKTKPLNFENLVEPPATILDPPDPVSVIYRFRTGPGNSRDLIRPQLSFTSPSDGELNVDYNLTLFHLLFNDNVVPMINPSTVNNITIQLYDMTTDPLRLSPLATTVSFDYNDLQFKSVDITVPAGTMNPSSQYNLRVSAGSSIMDFQGNTVLQQDIFFTTKP